MKLFLIDGLQPHEKRDTHFAFTVCRTYRLIRAEHVTGTILAKEDEEGKLTIPIRNVTVRFRYRFFDSEAGEHTFEVWLEGGRKRMRNEITLSQLLPLLDLALLLRELEQEA